MEFTDVVEWQPRRLDEAVIGVEPERVEQACRSILRGHTRDDWHKAFTQLRVDAGVCGNFLSFGDAVVDYFRVVQAWFLDDRQQSLIAVLAIGVGWLVAWDASLVPIVLVPATTAILAMIVVHIEALHWDFVPTVIAEVVLHVQVVAATLLVVHTGFEGTQALFGIALGSAAAFLLGSTPRSWGQGAALFWYQAGATIGFLLSTVWRPLFLAVCVPLFGGLFVVTGSGVLLSRMFAGMFGEDVAGSLPLLPSPIEPWCSVIADLVSEAVPLVSACLVLAMLLQRFLYTPTVTTLCVTVGMALALLPQHLGLLCLFYRGSEHGCPAKMRPAEPWPWALFGSLLCIAFTASALRRQLEMLPDWEAQHFWQEYISGLSMPNKERQEESRIMDETPSSPTLPTGRRGGRLQFNGDAEPESGVFGGVEREARKTWLWIESKLELVRCVPREPTSEADTAGSVNTYLW